MAKLIIEPKTARLYRDTETFGKMDPYVTFECGGKKKKTKTHTDGGKHPSWKDTISIDVQSSDLTITIWDKDTFTDDKIGTKTIKVSDISSKGGYKDWLQLMYKGKVAGEIYLEIQYIDKASKSGSAGMYPGSGMYYQPPASAPHGAPGAAYYAPPSYAPAPGGYAPAPGSYAPASGGYAPAPGGYAPAPSAYPSAPAPSAYPSAPTPGEYHGYPPAQPAYPAPSPGGYYDGSGSMGYPAPTPTVYSPPSQSKYS